MIDSVVHMLRTDMRRGVWRWNVAGDSAGRREPAASARTAGATHSFVTPASEPGPIHPPLGRFPVTSALAHGAMDPGSRPDDSGRVAFTAHARAGSANAPVPSVSCSFAFSRVRCSSGRLAQ